MLSEKKELVSINVVPENGIVGYNQLIIIKRDGEEVSRVIHSTTIYPGQDYSNEPAEVQAICKTVHTTKVVDAYKAKVANGTTETDS